MRKTFIIVFLFALLFMATYADAVSYKIHDLVTGVMHEAKDIYRTNARSVDHDMDSIEARLPLSGNIASTTDLNTHIADTTTAHGQTSENVVSKIIMRDASGNFKAGTMTGDITGNAGTATKLQVAKTIAGTAFDGSTNIPIDHVNLLNVGTMTHAALEAAIALKASQIQVDSEAVALQNHIGNLATHGHNSPVGQPSNRLEVTDGAGGWQFTSVAAAGGGVTNAVDLNSSTASFSRLMNSLASNAQTALNQIDQNAATTAEVAAKANTADVYTKSETNDTIANAINAIPPPDFTNYYTKAQTNSTIENAIAAATASIDLSTYSTTTQMNAAIASATLECQAKTWTPLSMANGDYTGEVMVDGMAASATVGQCLYLASGGWTIAKADSATTIPAKGLCVETGTGNRKVLLRGIVRNSGWSFTKGQKIYVSAATAGAITATAPNSTGNQVQIIGVALSADTVFFDFNTTFVEI